MTLNFSVGSPLSALAGGVVRMRRMTFLLKSELSIVLIPAPTEKSRSLGGNHWNRNCSFFQARITEMFGHVQFDLLIIAIKFIYSTLLWRFQFSDGEQAKPRLAPCPAAVAQWSMTCARASLSKAVIPAKAGIQSVDSAFRGFAE